MRFIILCLVFFLNIEQVIGYGFRFANHYESNMVLQRSPQRAVLWGYGEADQHVTVTVGDETQTYVALVKKDYRGFDTWKIVLNKYSAGGPYQIVAKSTWRGERVAVMLRNVMFGDVWVCGGQSNMVFTVSMMNKTDFERELAIAGNYDKVRLFTVERYISQEPVYELEFKNILQHWMVASADAIGGAQWQYFSAICWLYGRKLYDEYKIPIGLISSNYGGTRIEAWSSHEALQKCGIDEQRHNELMQQYAYLGPSFGDPNSARALWNGMIVPLLNCTIKGVIWYQGEGNAVTTDKQDAEDLHNPYDCSFPVMIDDWRKMWYEGTSGNTDPMFPFGFVQLASLWTDATAAQFPLVRWEQTVGHREVPNADQQNVFMAVAMDTTDDRGPFGSIHPRDKMTVADRLIRGARVVAYEEKGVSFQGPILESCSLVSPQDFQYQIILIYKNVDKAGIVVLTIEGFEILTISSEKWIPVNLTSTSSSNKGTLYLDVPNKHIIAVRYAWTRRPCDYKKCAIYSATDGLPSPPTICYLE